MATVAAATTVAAVVTNTAIGAAVTELAKTGVSVLIVYTSHYGSSKIYDSLCVPDGVVGFLQGLITTASPWCRLTLEFMKATENQYSTAILIGVSRLAMSVLGI